MKTMLFSVAGSKCGRVFYLGLLLSLAISYYNVPLTNGQQVGISLKFHGVTIPNDSLVDLDDIMYTSLDQCCNDLPSNTNPRDEALLCVTDLVDCCDAPHTVRGDWYYPDGRRVEFDFHAYEHTFRANRGSNEDINGRIFYGSVRLFRRWSGPPERGRFRCELPSAANPSVNQILYVNILEIGAVTISFSGSSTAGGSSSLVCSATITHNPLPPNVPSPTFKWFFGPYGNASLPSGLTPTAAVLSSSTPNSNTYSSILHFCQLRQSHAGNYTCRLGAETLAAHTTFTVNALPMIVMVTSNFNDILPLMVGQTSYRYSLTCNVSGGDIHNLPIAYQWTRNQGVTSTQVGTNLLILSLSPLRLSDAGSYSCTVTSILLNDPVIADNSLSVIIQIPDPQSVIITTSPGTMVLNGSDVTMTCSIQMNHNVLVSELSFLVVNASLTKPDGSVLELSNPAINGTNITYTTTLSSFRNSDSGNYTCTATVRPQPTSAYLTGTGQLSNTAIIAIDKRSSSDSDLKALRTSTCEANIGIAVGSVILVEGIIAGVIAIVVVLYWLMIRWRKPNKSNIPVTVNMSYGEVKLDTLRDVGGEYEDPDRLARSEQCGDRNYNIMNQQGVQPYKK